MKPETQQKHIAMLTRAANDASLVAHADHVAWSHAIIARCAFPSDATLAPACDEAKRRALASQEASNVAWALLFAEREALCVRMRAA